jgi:hypothetical protein
MAEGAPMFVDCMLKLPAWPLLNPLVAAIGHVHVCPRASHPIECRVSTGPAQCLRAPRFQDSCRSYQTRRRAKCPSRRNEDVSGGIPSHRGGAGGES